MGLFTFLITYLLCIWIDDLRSVNPKQTFRGILGHIQGSQVVLGHTARMKRTVIRYMEDR